MTYSKQLDLFPDPKPEKVRSPLIEYSFLLSDGSTVLACFDRYYFEHSCHIEFRGESISETGYYSLFPSDNWSFDPDDKVIERIKNVAEKLRENLITQKLKESRKRKRR